MHLKKAFITIFLCLFALSVSSMKSEAKECTAIIGDYLQKKAAIEKKIEQLSQKKRIALGKAIAAKKEARGVETRQVKKYQKQSDKFHVSRLRLYIKLDDIADDMDLKLKTCVENKMKRGRFKNDWTNDKFTKAYVYVLKQEDRLQKQVVKCIEDSQAQELDIEERCAGIHARWAQYELQKYKLVDSALK